MSVRLGTDVSESSEENCHSKYRFYHVKSNVQLLPIPMVEYRQHKIIIISFVAFTLVTVQYAEQRLF